jgi:hypothetical protein
MVVKPFVEEGSFRTGKADLVVCPDTAPLFMLERLAGMEEPVVVRDPRGRGPRPSLVRRPGRHRGGPDLEVRGPFTVIQRFSVDPRDGAEFARLMRDGNPIHTEGDVVPGAMTAARAILLPELLIDSARIERAKLRFRAMAYYHRPMVNIYRFELLQPDSLKVDVTVRQDGQEVADGQLSIDLGARRLSVWPQEEPAPSPASEAVAEEAERVSGFLKCLRVDPSLHFRTLGPVYPRAYLASLPPGEMVRKYSGDGGILNVLDLRFSGEAMLGLASPSVELEDPARARKSFRKILARIGEGVRTLCSGFAMVLPVDAREPLTARTVS